MNRRRKQSKKPLVRSMEKMMAVKVFFVELHNVIEYDQNTIKIRIEYDIIFVFIFWSYFVSILLDFSAFDFLKNFIKTLNQYRSIIAH